MEPVTLLAGVLVLLGLLGIVVPLLPGLPLVWAGALLWAVSVHTAGAWLVLGLVTALAALGLVLKYVLPGRRLQSSNVGTPTMLAGVAVGVVGFFVLPVVGGVLGRLAVHDHRTQGGRTGHARRARGRVRHGGHLGGRPAHRRLRTAPRPGTRHT